MIGRPVLAVVIMLPLLGGTASADHRTLWLRNVHSGEELKVAPFGQYGLPFYLQWLRLEHLFRSRVTTERHQISPRLLRTLAHLQEHFGGRRIDLVSGFRSPPDPGDLCSYHATGAAADIAIPGIALRDIKESAIYVRDPTVWLARNPMAGRE